MIPIGGGCGSFCGPDCAKGWVLKHADRIEPRRRARMLAAIAGGKGETMQHIDAFTQSKKPERKRKRAAETTTTVDEMEKLRAEAHKRACAVTVEAETKHELKLRGPGVSHIQYLHNGDVISKIMDQKGRWDCKHYMVARIEGNDITLYPLLMVDPKYVTSLIGSVRATAEIKLNLPVKRSEIGQVRTFSMAHFKQ